MNDCSKNLFCASLPEQTRAKLCARCCRRLEKAGSMCLYDNFGGQVSLILDGVILSASCVDESSIDVTQAPPLFALCLPGRPLSLDVTFYGESLLEEMPYSFNDLTCLTDCCIATFDHGVFRELFEEDRAFAKALMRATMNLVADIGQFAALERADSVNTKVSLLMQKLLEFDLCLSRSDVARVLACNRTSVSRAFSRIEEKQPEFFARYSANKNRPAAYFRQRGRRVSGKP